MKNLVLFISSALFICCTNLTNGQSGAGTDKLTAPKPLLSKALFGKEPLVRVRVMNTTDIIKIVFNDEWSLSAGEIRKIFPADSEEVILKTDNGNIIIKEKSGETVLPAKNFNLKGVKQGARLKVKDVPYGVGWWWEGKEDKIYEGELNIFVNEKSLFDVVITLPLEEYLKGVVPYEIGGNAPLEAIKAQAVAARSEAITALKSKIYSGEHYDLTSDVECQVYGGNERRTEISDRAVLETAGQVLSENDSVISAYYASNCGGHSEIIQNVWPERVAWASYSESGFDWSEQHSTDLSDEENIRKWILSRPQSYCNPEAFSDLPQWSKNNFRWKREFTTEEITKMTSAGNDRGKLMQIKSINRGTSGRIYKAEFVYEKDTLLIEGELKIRQMFTPPLRSSAFIADRKENGFIIQGAGWGHGVGMCQSGAVTMANLGKSYNVILKHYYKKAELVRVY